MSLTIASWVVATVDQLLSWANVPVAPGDIDVWLKVTVAILAAIGIWYGRFRHGDITWYGMKKS